MTDNMLKKNISSMEDINTNDQMLGLINENFSRLVKKCNLMEDRVKKGEEEAYRIKNDLLPIKNDINLHKSEIRDLKESDVKIHQSIDEMKHELENTLQTNDSNFRNYVDSEIKKVYEKMDEYILKFLPLDLN